MFVIGRVSPSSKGYAFYVGDFKMLAELLPSNAQQRWGWRVEMRTECRREKSPGVNKGILCEAWTGDTVQMSGVR